MKEEADRALSIKDVARLMGTTTRTLRWYDTVGLVVAERDRCSGYRVYRQEHLKRLQQVVFLRELDFSLEKINGILADPGFDRQQALHAQIDALKKKRARFDQMIRTLELTLREERGEYVMGNHERFKGFDFSHNPHEAEARKRWGDKQVDAANDRLGSLAEQEKQDFAVEMEKNFSELACLIGTDPASPEVQEAIGRWHVLLQRMGTYTPSMFANLGRMYVEDPRFTETLDHHGEGLARLMRDAMIIWAEHHE